MEVLKSTAYITSRTQPDSIMLEISRGNGAKASFITIAKANGEKLENTLYNYYHSHWELIQNEYILSQDSALFDFVIDSLYLKGSRYRETPTPSLAWLLAARCEDSIINNPNVVMSKFTFTPQWVTQHTMALDSVGYSLKVVGQKQFLPCETNHNGTQWVYYWNHEDLIEKKVSNELSLLIGDHNVMLKRKELYCTVFIADANSTAAPEKLRWKAVEKVVIQGDYVFILLTTGDFYMVNYLSGNVFRLEIEYFKPKNKINTFYIKNKHLYIGTKILLLEELFKKLR
jgi:hypothetical protein